MEYKQLKEKLIKHCQQYYLLDQSDISDEEYDRLYRDLKHMEKVQGFADPDSPTQVVGIQIQHGRKIKHPEKLYSLDNVFSVNELNKFFEKYPDETYCVEVKLDGMSGNLIYNEGKLSVAVTRGNGLIGENITENVLMIADIPKTIDSKELIEVRGEFVIYQEDFIKYNESMIQKGLEPYRTARNLASGTMRGLNKEDVVARSVRFVAYGTTAWKDKDYLDRRKQLVKLGFKYTQTIVVDKLEDVENICETIKNDREKYAFHIDGAVIKLNSANLQTALGYTTKDPKWAVARKWNKVGIETRLIDVEAQVGRTGVITPVGKIEPTDIDGVIVTSATLHNYDEVKRLGIQIGNKITIIRSGEVIPKIESVVFEESVDPNTYLPIEEPKQCPVCSADVFTNGAKLYCSNRYCFGQKLAQLNYFVSREAMNIIDLSEQTIKQLVYKGFVRMPSDIYKLTKKNLLALDGYGEKSAEKLIANINATRKPTLEKFIVCLGIPSVGVRTAESLAKKFCSIQNLVNARVFDLLEIRDIGDKTANDIVNYFNQSENQDIVNSLLDEVTPHHNVEETFDLLKEKTFVITGSFPEDRKLISKLLEQYGAKVSGSVSSKTSLVIQGQSPGDNKIQDAIKHGITIVDYSNKTANDILDAVIQELHLTIKQQPF